MRPSRYLKFPTDRTIPLLSTKTGAPGAGRVAAMLSASDETGSLGTGTAGFFVTRLAYDICGIVAASSSEVGVTGVEVTARAATGGVDCRNCESWNDPLFGSLK